jgi:hypothetical protein
MNRTVTRRLLIAIGLLGVLAFLFTGVFMRTNYAMDTLDPGTRMLLRARHIYLLWASLLNLGVGSYFQIVPQGWRRRLQLLGSGLILAGPPLLTGAFFHEAMQSNIEGPLARPAIFAALAGTVLVFIAGAKRGSSPGQDT